eukprot:gnl/TRDRNA2_/TRDRNA2_204583_c0_seq1.p1 gnl/TRDRNA2_/TRDRNA2_204583_c0~~gnl/TRDRNA2_/TRDRNA2_204583_c0_seq1.p1  ORF type:complete len:212 (-),score=25.13 gnl/TRDRNA2_/TRDRNA2_204583_c0_seq1:6-641(-)
MRGHLSKNMWSSKIPNQALMRELPLSSEPHRSRRRLLRRSSEMLRSHRSLSWSSSWKRLERDMTKNWRGLKEELSKLLANKDVLRAQLSDERQRALALQQRAELLEGDVMREEKDFEHPKEAKERLAQTLEWVAAVKSGERWSKEQGARPMSARLNGQELARTVSEVTGPRKSFSRRWRPRLRWIRSQEHEQPSMLLALHDFSALMWWLGT